MTRVAGIVLGAGASKRLGRPKQTLPFGDTTLLGHVLRDAEASSLDPLVLVISGAVAAPPPTSRARMVSNDRYEEGCASSLLAGLDAVEDCDAVMLVLGDMPGVGANTIDQVRAAWEVDRPWMALCEWAGVPGHPMVFSASAFSDLRGLHGDKAVWKLFDANPERVKRVPIARELPRDVDTWEDYEAAGRSLGIEIDAGVLP